MIRADPLRIYLFIYFVVGIRSREPSTHPCHLTINLLMTVVVTVRRYLNKRSEKRNVGSKPELKNGRFFIEAEVGVTDSTGRCALCIVQRSLFNDMSYR